MERTTDIKLKSLIRRAKQIKDIQNITNTILANACYSDKEMENQINMAQKMGNLDAEEYDLVCEAWATRKKIARSLIHGLKIYLGGINDQDKEKS